MLINAHTRSINTDFKFRHNKYAVLLYFNPIRKKFDIYIFAPKNQSILDIISARNQVFWNDRPAI